MLPMLWLAVTPGVWEAPDYGVILEITTKKVRLWDTLPGYCLLNAEFAQSPIEDLSRFTPLDKLPAHCTGKKDKDPRRNFQILDQTFQRHYAFFDRRGGTAWTEARAKTEAALPGDWFPAACAWIKSLTDAHVTLSDGQRECGFSKVDRRAAALAHRDYLLTSDTFLQSPAQPHGRRRLWTGRFKQDPSIGYLNLFTMGGFAEGQTDETPARVHRETAAQLLDGVLASLKDTRALVIDLRFNQGGFDEVALELASRFASTEFTAYTKHVMLDGKAMPPQPVKVTPTQRGGYQGKVAVLIGPATVSAAEVAALAFRAIPQVTLIGQATEGALSDRLDRKLPNGWTFSLSNEVYTAPGGQTFEGQGVPPSLPTQDPVAEALRLFAK